MVSESGEREDSLMMVLKRAANGAMLSGNGEREVFEYDEEDMGGLVELLYAVGEQLAPATSRYSKERISVTIVHGDKYECEDRKCGICKEG